MKKKKSFIESVQDTYKGVSIPNIRPLTDFQPTWRGRRKLKITELKLNTDTRYSKSQIEHSRKLGLPVPVGHWKLKNGKLLCSIQPTKSDMEQIKKLRWKGFTAGDIFND